MIAEEKLSFFLGNYSNMHLQDIPFFAIGNLRIPQKKDKYVLKIESLFQCLNVSLPTLEQ